MIETAVQKKGFSVEEKMPNPADTMEEITLKNSLLKKGILLILSACFDISTVLTCNLILGLHLIMRSRICLQTSFWIPSHWVPRSLQVIESIWQKGRQKLNIFFVTVLVFLLQGILCLVATFGYWNYFFSAPEPSSNRPRTNWSPTWFVDMGMRMTLKKWSHSELKNCIQ